MKISRRKFLGVATVGSGVLLNVGVLGQGIMPPIVDDQGIKNLTFLSFFANMNTEFEFVNEDRIKVPIQLVAVDDARPMAKQKWGQGEENFVLKFHGHLRYPLKQGTYEVEHFALGKFSLFITEGKTDKAGITIIAVINRVTR